MANLTFPSNPTNGQKYTFNGKVFEYSSSTGRWSATRAQLLGSLPDDVTIDAPTLSVSLNTIALDTVGANVYVTYTIDQDVDARLSVSGLENTTATLHRSNNTIVVTAGATAFANGQINLVVSNGRSTDTEVINVSASYASWDLSTATYIQSLDTSSQQGNPTALFFKPDGTKMYLLGYSLDEVDEFDLSTPWDISTASHLQSLTVSDTVPRGLYFSPDGTKLYYAGGSGDKIYEYTLSNPWDVSSATYIQSLSTSPQTTVEGVTFKPDGLEMYIVGTDGADSIRRYTLSTAWDLSTATFTNESVDVGEPNDISFKPDGSVVFILDSRGSVVYRSLSTPWDITDMTVEAGKGFATGTQELNPEGLFISNDGLKMYIVGLQNDSIFEYTLS